MVDIKEEKKITAVTKKLSLFCDFYRGQTANPHSWMLVSAQPREGLIWARCRLGERGSRGEIARAAAGLASSRPWRARPVAASVVLSQLCSTPCQLDEAALGTWGMEP